MFWAGCNLRLSSQIQDVNVCARARVIRQIVAGVVWIVIDHDVVIVPKPAVCVVIIIGRNLEEITAHIKAIRAAAVEPPDVLRADATDETPMLPRMVKMIVRIVAAGIVSDPAVIFRVNVRGFRMAFLIAEIRVVLLLLWRPTRL